MGMNVKYKPYAGKNGLLGFVSIEFEGNAGKFWITDMTYRQGPKGAYVTMPSKKLKEPKADKNGKMQDYQDIVFGDRAFKQWLNNEVAKLAGNTNPAQAQGDDIPF